MPPSRHHSFRLKPELSAIWTIGDATRTLGQRRCLRISVGTSSFVKQFTNHFRSQHLRWNPPKPASPGPVPPQAGWCRDHSSTVALQTAWALQPVAVRHRLPFDFKRQFESLEGESSSSARRWLVLRIHPVLGRPAIVTECTDRRAATLRTTRVSREPRLEMSGQPLPQLLSSRDCPYCVMKLIGWHSALFLRSSNITAGFGRERSSRGSGQSTVGLLHWPDDDLRTQERGGDDGDPGSLLRS
jgi:hypothetical protein